MKTSSLPTRLAVSLASAGLLLLFAGCATRSISDSGYQGGYHGRNPFYRGELSEFDLLGLHRGAQISEEQISQALDAPKRASLRKGSSLLLIQSGAYQPDEPMREALNRQFNPVPFSGQPGPTNGLSYARSLRLAAAQAGCETIVAYWGALESARKGLSTKSVSWVPVAGWILPDEKQQMRLRLKVAIVDVRSGQWTMFTSKPYECRALSDRFTRESSDQGQVEKLKKLAYESVAQELATTYSR